MGSSTAPLSTPEGPICVSGAPNLPAGFTDAFASARADDLIALTAFLAPYRERGGELR